MDVYWLEQSEADVSPDNDWLSASEVAYLNAMRIPKRRADWRLGRWTAKRAVSLHLNAPGDPQALASIEIRPAATGAPEVFIAGRPATAGISISHCNGNALCAIAPFGTSLGCDLELVEPRSDAFVADYFTSAEQTLIAQAQAANRPWLVTLLWSAKESALKALHEGLRLDTRSVIVSMAEGIAPPDHGEETCAANLDSALRQNSLIWQPLEVHCTGGKALHGWWRLAGNLLRALVAAPAPNSPIALRTLTQIEAECAASGCVSPPRVPRAHS
jgi:4'-phosphopantetheinyl transferase